MKKKVKKNWNKKAEAEPDNINNPKPGINKDSEKLIKENEETKKYLLKKRIDYKKIIFGFIIFLVVFFMGLLILYSFESLGIFNFGIKNLVWGIKNIPSGTNETNNPGSTSPTTSATNFSNTSSNGNLKSGIGSGSSNGGSTNGGTTPTPEVPDTTPPSFTNPRNLTGYINYSFSELMAATDSSGISSYWLNDTSVFIISQSGQITNVSNLSQLKLYWLNLNVNDTKGNTNSLVFYINITDEPPVPQNLIEVFNRINRTYDKRAAYGYGNNSINVSLLEDKNNNYIWQPETLMFEDTETGHEIWRMTNSPNGYSIYFTDIGEAAWSADGKYLALITVGRPTQTISNFDSWYKQYWGEMIVETNGDSFRFIPNSSSWTNHWAFVWSPQIPDTYYDYKNYWIPDTMLYKNVITQNSSHYLPVFDANISLSIGKLISGDGRKIIGSGGNRTPEAFVWFYPITIYPDNKAGFDLNKTKYPVQGYSAWRNLPNYAGTDNLNQTSYFIDYFSMGSLMGGHDKYYAGDGSWLYWMVPTDGLSSSAWWRLKVLGSAADGGAYSNNADFPVTNMGYDFGEAWPENHGTFHWWLNVTNVNGNFIFEPLNFSISGSKNYLILLNTTTNVMEVSFYYPYGHPFIAPQIGDVVRGLYSGANATVIGIIHSFYPSPFVADTTDYYPDKTCYWSHFVPDRWGRISLFSLSCDNPPGSWENGVGHNYGPATWDIQNHSYVVPSFGGGAQHHDWHGFTDWVVSNSDNSRTGKIYAAIYNNVTSRIIIANPYISYNGGGTYSGPTESPDGTKVGWPSELLNLKNDYDAYWAVVTYPYPATNLTATYSGGVKINFLPPKYTERGWPFANDTLNKIRNGSWPALDSNGNEIGEPLYAREIKKFHLWRASNMNGPWSETGTVNYLQNYSYHSTEDSNNELFMLHPVDSTGRKINPTNKIFYTDSVSDGTYYYAITSEEYSGLESDSLSEILQVNVSGGAITGSGVVQAKGQKNFWTTAPALPTNFDYIAMNEQGYYNLTWTEPVDSKIRYYNIYYSNVSNPPALQSYRIASVPVGWNHFFDYAADPNATGYYGITSVDRYGNEGSIVYKTGVGSLGKIDVSGKVIEEFPEFNFLNWLFNWIFGNMPKNEMTGNFVTTKYINNSR